MRKLQDLKVILFLSFGIFFCIKKASSQCDFPALPKTGNTIRSFVPKGWVIKDSVKGDFNKDKLEDIIIVLANKVEDNNESYEYDCNRPLVILQKTNFGYSLSAYTTKGVLCKRCGGAFGDPYESISLEGNVLNINHYAGSAWRWTKNFTFRFQQNKWMLIGVSDASYWSLGECEGSVGDAGYNQNEANFNTSKAHIVKTRNDECIPYKDVWMAFKKKPFVTLQQFVVDNNYFPVKDN